MLRLIVCFMVLGTFGFVQSAATPKIRVRPKQSAGPPPSPAETLNLPSNATSIRADITDNFSCQNRSYGYYADIENDCQIFHVCLPVKYADGKERTFRWSFICPEETQFNQENFTCARAEDSIECSESEKYYDLNKNFGEQEEEEEDEPSKDEEKAKARSNSAEKPEQSTRKVPKVKV